MFRSAPRSSFQIHPLALAAYDVLRRLGIPEVWGPGLCVSAPDAAQGLPSLAVAGFGWLHCTEDVIPVLELPAQTTPAELRKLGWREVAAQLTPCAATSEQRASFLMALSQRCPREELGLFGLPASRDVTQLRRRFRLRRERLEPKPEPDVFTEAVRSLGLR